jgi:hypothetical protein
MGALDTKKTCPTPHVHIQINTVSPQEQFIEPAFSPILHDTSAFPNFSFVKWKKKNEKLRREEIVRIRRKLERHKKNIYITGK